MHRILTLLVFANIAIAQVTAIVGGTVIDGNGGPPIPNAVVLLSGTRITAVGSSESVKVPSGAAIIPAAGRFIVPGFIDTNVHLSLYGGARDRYETLAKYFPRESEIVLEAAQIQLQHGVTTVRDSYGMLLPLTQIRDTIARGDAIGTRILAAGNIVGWGGPYSITFSLTPQGNLTRFQEQMNEAIAQGAGENLPDLSAEELRVAINKYLDKGPDFLKYGATSHFSEPSFIGFSPDAQKVMVEETHKRGKVAEVHSTTIEGLRISLLAGIDLIQHPELMTPRELPDDLVALIKERKVIGSMLASTITGEAWTKHLSAKEDTNASAEQRRRSKALSADLDTRRRNAQKLVKAGCTLTVGTDSYWGSAPEFAIDPKPPGQNHGIGTVMAIEGLVELGMTPSQAITSGTKNGALACRRLNDFGTIEPGKLADIVILDADPLADIHNIRKVNAVIKEGKLIDTARLPEKRVLSTASAPDTFRVRFDTSKGAITLELHRDWAPNGVDRFYDLVRSGYFNESRFFRVTAGRWAQFGINGNPEISNAWRSQTIADEVRRESNVRGTVAFAFAVPNGRTTQLFINLKDNSPTHDSEPFVPIGRVIEGMEVADKLNSEYGEKSGGGVRAGKQDPLFSGGNAYLKQNFPDLDWIKTAAIVPDH